MQKGDPGKSLFENKRLRAPQSHGESLQDPNLDQAGQLWADNCQRDEEFGELSIGASSLNTLQELGRREVLSLASKYSQSYLDVDLTGRSKTQIVMSGHQPELFHPGVWFKNFSLSRIAEQFKATPINLVVDNDLCGNASLRYPKEIGNQFRFGTLPIDSTGPSVPFEVREVKDWEYFSSFPDRVEKAIASLVKGKPLASRIWDHISTVKDSIEVPRLGQVIAAGRHRLENEIGLTTLEVPLSQISQTQSFAMFVSSILFEIERFQIAYNETISEYRRQFNIRSEGHPVPGLEVNEGWRESPFWIWRQSHPTRARLFVKPNQGSVTLSNLQGWELEFNHDSFMDQFCSLNDQRVAIRPRALMTTMFSRLVLSDLFLHGIGGAIYDRLTDEICDRFFKMRPPKFVALSATMKLHHYSKNRENLVTRTDLVKAKQLVRELTFHPEKFLYEPGEGSSEIDSLIKSKQTWVGDQSRSYERHHAIVKINEDLQGFLNPGLPTAIEKQDSIGVALKNSEILGSREYSLALFPEALVEDLNQL